MAAGLDAGTRQSVASLLGASVWQLPGCPQTERDVILSGDRDFYFGTASDVGLPPPEVFKVPCLYGDALKRADEALATLGEFVQDTIAIDKHRGRDWHPLDELVATHIAAIDAARKRLEAK